MQKFTLHTVGGVITAVIASLCCNGPIAVALIGVGSISAFSIFETYRPYLIGFPVVILGLAFYLTYRKREVKCEDGTCKIENAGKWSKISLWLAAVIAITAILFPYFGASSSAATNISDVPGTTVVLSIKGMDCAGCARGVEGMLAGVKGVRQAKVDFDNGMAEVIYDPQIVKPETFIHRINETSYEASIVKNRK